MAQAVTYECALKPGTPFGWIPPDLIIIQGENNPLKAVVYDGLIHRSFGKPIAAYVTQRKNSWRFSWTVPDMQIGNRRNTISGDYIAVYYPKTGKINMRVFLQGADILPRGHGTCKVKK